jgi:hypothetical protein
MPGGGFRHPIDECRKRRSARNGFASLKKANFDEELLFAVKKALAIKKTERGSDLNGLQPFAGLDSGKMGMMAAEYARNEVKCHVRMHYCDSRNDALEKIPAAKEMKIPGDSMRLQSLFTQDGRQLKDFCHLIVVRDGISYVPQGMQVDFLSQLRLSLVRGGRITIADIYAKNDEVQNALNSILSLAQEYSGRNPRKDGTCHVPAYEDWNDIVANASFADFKVACILDRRVTADDLMPAGKRGAASARRDALSAMNKAIIKIGARNKMFAVTCGLGVNRGEATFLMPYLVVSATRKA